MRRAGAVGVIVAFALAACSSNDHRATSRSSVAASSSTSSSTTSTTTPTDLAAVHLTLTKVADAPRATATAVRTGDPALYVAEQGGLLVALRDGRVDPVFDLTSRVTSSGEHGLLGIAFSPDGTKLYVHFSAAGSGATTLEEYAFNDGRVDPATRRLVLTVPDLQANHNGGQLAFGSDGNLYLALGDGGGAFDMGAGHARGGNGQSLGSLNGKILRIDPTPTLAAPYSIPADNPFARGGGRPEIWVYGLRNPWRFSFDSATDDVWIADVGQNQYEEIDMVPFAKIAGSNFGWSAYEASHALRSGLPVAATVLPVFETSHADGNCAIVGGYVYRGSKIPALRGAYVFSDYCNGAVGAIVASGGKVVQQRDLGVASQDIASFGQDGDGELYVLSKSQGIFRIDPA